MLALLGALALAAPAAAKPTTARPATPRAAADACVLQYQRADNMWAPFGIPDGNLGTETVTVSAGQSQGFSSGWKYEKLRNDGVNFYSSHLRVATNTGTRQVMLVVRNQFGWQSAGLQCSRVRAGNISTTS
jgi:hypothetical protein